MATIIGHNPERSESYEALHEKVKLQEGLINELSRLNSLYEEEMKRVVEEYDKLYEAYEKAKGVSWLS